MHTLTKIINSILKIIVNITLFLLDLIYKNGYRRFFVLETIARIPYISYLSVLHLYQSIGRHPSYELMNMHFHQSVNEEYHLLIMEELGGNDLWINRFFARSLGVFYFWTNCALYLFFPNSGYYLMEVVESHAADTYTSFLHDHETVLKQTNATKICHDYFFSTHTRMTSPPEKTESLNLYQVFESIRNDEVLHSKEMQNCSTFTSLSSKNPGVELIKKP
ncbi:MAG: plastoquinol terminal oxidase [candidate division SR1 bacterium]|nr:plastoquinol terminal oxidase [candidate division SR1 bacterium]